MDPSAHMASDAPYSAQHLYPAVAVPLPHGIPTEGPATHPEGPPRHYPYELVQGRISYTQQASSSALPHQQPRQNDMQLAATTPAPPELYVHTQQHPIPLPPSPTSDQTTPGGSQQQHPLVPGQGSNHYTPSTPDVPRLPPILQVEKQTVTTSATQIASANRRRNEAHFVCPVPGCGSTFTRRFNLRGIYPLCPPCPQSDSFANNRSSQITHGGETLCVRLARMQEGLCASARLQVRFCALSGSCMLFLTGFQASPGPPRRKVSVQHLPGVQEGL